MSALLAPDPEPSPRPAPDDHHDRTVLGHRVHVAHRPGAPGRLPLVLVNGIGASLELFDPLVEALDPERPVVRFDVPGIGGSPLPWVPLPMAGLAVLVRGLLDDLGYGKADILGLSWGGGIAQQFALQHPDRTARLALVSTGTGAMMVPARFTVLAKMLTPRRYNDRSYRREAGAEIYQGESQAAVDEVFSRVHPVMFRAYLFQLMALMSWTSLPVLPFIGAPTLVLAGRRDPVIPVVNAHLMGALIPRGTVHLHEGGHLGLLTRPDELGRVVEEFLDA
ncbi:alpha/beta fold hydrolase [Actinomycetospora callitridis]|uniref:alpha/beta fold hydrolase n=1 Tax=Actinomycetospora callitridis TaxID=913944 RepID=UPI0023654DD1|nr:alpha/beta hydrolase [Actinomycetospora callitridis]MDD7920487.1 alpha/beta hydrolase [Actinomycetospora callitridis]